ncbi:MAG TPA: peptidoglycan DD-metalloendopeptidase family protein [Bacteroidales bacterium]|nr:peptidoglycan DD-metalloendopeptidase family protein [Bacteroidales bacterium]
MAIKCFFTRVFLCTVLIVSGAIGTVYAQNKNIDKIRAEAEKTKKEIAATNRLIQEAEKTKKITVERLSLLNQQINLRESYLLTITREITEIEKNITVSKALVRSLESQLEQLQKEYSLILFTLYKVHNSYDQLIFVLSADNFNQAYNRIQYLHFYSNYMIERSQEIALYQDSIKNHIQTQQDLLVQKKNLLGTEQKQKQRLSQDKSKESQALQQLQSRQQELKKQLQQKQLLAKKLDKEIEELIKEAARAAKATPQDNIISKNFAENKGNLPWPSANGRITQKFGTYKHPTLPIEVECNGIEISTTKGTMARAIFDGTVSKIVVIPGRNTAVLIKHGQYYTVYDNLINVRVKAGQKVSAKQELGTIYTDPETGVTVLQLQIWNQLQKLNPEPWLSK